MAAPAVLVVSVEPLDYEYGGWCRTCLLPSGVQVLAVITIGPSSHLRTFQRCTACLGGNVDPPETHDVDHL